MSEKDGQLIGEFNDSQNEQAFVALVQRHVNLVFATALRQVGDHGIAEEVTQNVFITLAQSAGKLGRHPTIAGWLYQTTLNKSRERLRSELRRQRREQIAVNLEKVRGEGDSVWASVVPLLDEALLELREADRLAVIMHFMEGQTYGEVGATLGVGEDAARKRVHRCLDQLTHFFRRRGFVVPALAVGTPLFVMSSQAAPAGLSASAVTAGLCATHTAASGSTLTIIKGALKIMAWSKTKTAMVVGLTAILGVGTTCVVIKVSFFPAIKDTYFQPNYRHFQNLPRGLFALRPTHFTTPTEGLEYSGETSSPSSEHVTLLMGRNRSFEQLMTTAYGGYQPYTIFPANFPKGNYDYLCTILDSRAGERLQTAIRKKLGYAASWQERDTEVLLLKVRQPASSGLKSTSGSKNSEGWQASETRLEFRNRSLWNLANAIERAINMPVLDQTGRPEALDFDLTCARIDLVRRDWNSMDQALGRLGLELVSTNLPTKMLVVEKAQ